MLLVIALAIRRLPIGGKTRKPLRVVMRLLYMGIHDVYTLIRPDGVNAPRRWPASRLGEQQCAVGEVDWVRTWPSALTREPAPGDQVALAPPPHEKVCGSPRTDVGSCRLEETTYNKRNKRESTDY
jgi:hypothetical protein